MIREIGLARTHCFDSGSAFKDLTKVNYVFGPNGSGKTTVSTRLANLDGALEDSIALDIKWEDSPQTIKVYNRNYMRRAFTSVNGEEPGVFLLGEEDGAVFQGIQEITAQKKKADQKAAGAQAQLDQRLEEARDLRTELANNVWDKRLVIPVGLQQHMRGLRGSKDACLENVLKTAEAYSGRGTEHLQALALRAEVAFDDSVLERDLYPATPALNWDEGALEELLCTPIVGSADVPLMELIARLGHSDWVHQGLMHLNSESNSDGLCPFCQQAPPKFLAKQFAEVFDESYEEKTVEVEEFRQAIVEAGASLDAYKASYFKSLSLDLENGGVEDAFHLASLGLQAVRKAVDQKNSSLPLRLISRRSSMTSRPSKI